MDLDEVQGVQYQCGHQAPAEAGQQILVADMSEERRALRSRDGGLQHRHSLCLDLWKEGGLRLHEGKSPSICNDGVSNSERRHSMKVKP